MNVSHREKIMLLALLLVAFIAAGYYFVFIPVMDKSDSLILQQADFQAQADEIQIQLAALPGIEDEVQSLESSLAELSARYYPEILQEKLILQVDDFIKQSGIVASVYSYSSQQGVTITNYTTAEQPTSEQQTAVSDQQSNNSESSQPEVDESTTSGIQSVESTIADAGVFKVDMQFSGTYEQLRKFVTLIENSGKAIKLNNLNYQVEYTEVESVVPGATTPVVNDQPDNDEESTNTEETVNAPETIVESVAGGIRGKFSLEFYTINKIIDQDADYYNW